MKRFFIYITSLFLFITSSFSTPDEGMWLPMYLSRLNYEDMHKLGLKLTADEIYSINHSSLKDAIAIFGGGCTAELISDKGLLLTNHHCGLANIQEHSTVEHDYLKNGFWAKSEDEEIINEGLTVKFLVRMENVTDIILSQLDPEMSESDRKMVIAEVSDSIETEVIKETLYIANIKSFFNDNEYYLFVYEEFKDVRLVGAPPSSIGKFGGDTDNWMWPRHTGDFSLFRVYMSPDGKPAEYSKENIPYKPKHYLPISIKGIEKDDFTMVFGFPGSTERYLTSFGIESALNYKNPAIVKIRKIKLDIMREDMDKNDKVRIQYSTKYATIANYWKFFKGQSRGLKRLKVFDERNELENKFRNWISDNQDLIIKYGNALSDIEQAYKVINKYIYVEQYLGEAIFGSDIITLAFKFEALNFFLNKKNLKAFIEVKTKANGGKISSKKIEGIEKLWKERTESHTANLPNDIKTHFKDYYLPTDKKITTAMLELYYKDIPKDLQPLILDEITKKYKGDFSKYVDYAFNKSIFTTKEKINAFLENPDFKTLDKDPIFTLATSFIVRYRELYGGGSEMALAEEKLNHGNRLFIAGLREMKKNKKFYPDANSTLRFTYGTVQDYYPADAIYFNYYTTLAGIMEKEDADEREFIVPKKLKELYESKDFGRYGENGVMKVCFLTNLDITGGNSGSPVMDAEGNLIGVVFDGNWEAMSGDIEFEPKLQRTISVDIRYILFIIEKFAGAQNLIEEMKIIEPKKHTVNEKKEIHEIIEEEME